MGKKSLMVVFTSCKDIQQLENVDKLVAVE